MSIKLCVPVVACYFILFLTISYYFLLFLLGVPIGPCPCQSLCQPSASRQNESRWLLQLRGLDQRQNAAHGTEQVVIRGRRLSSDLLVAPPGICPAALLPLTAEILQVKEECISKAAVAP